MQNPFSTTFSKIPDHSYISTAQTDEIMENFNYELPSESVYKITGVRGSGKTVLLAKLEQEFESEARSREGWIVCRLNPAREMLVQMLAILCKEGLSKTTHGIDLNVSADVFGIGGGIGVSERGNRIEDIGVELDSALKNALDKKKKIFIGIDEISRTREMEIFALEFGGWLRAGYPVYLVCTGLYENIEQLYNVKNLTFFRRATTVKTEHLNLVRMSEMYRKKLGIDITMARKLAEMTKGYAYAFQELGILCFKAGTGFDLEEVTADLKTELYAYSYEKIWEELSDNDRKMVRLISDRDEYSREEVLSAMEKPGNYPVYRDRLSRRGVIDTKRGRIGLALPFFGEYVNTYC